MIGMRVCFGLLILAAVGCDHEKTNAQLDRLQAMNAELSQRLDMQAARGQALEQRLSQLEAEMKEFEDSYDSKLRGELSKNVAMVERLIQDANTQVDAIGKTVAELDNVQGQIKRLRDLCIQHESEASDANQIGKLKDTLDELERSVQKVERSLGTSVNIGSDIRRLESKVRQLESKVRFR